MICLWTSFLCAKFQGDQSMHLCFIVILQACEKHEEKEEHLDKNRNFGSLYLRNGWSDFLQILNVDSPGWQTTL